MLEKIQEEKKVGIEELEAEADSNLSEALAFLSENNDND